MAYIKHYWRRQRVLEECVDRGTKFQEWVERDVEHYCCSACGSGNSKRKFFLSPLRRETIRSCERTIQKQFLCNLRRKILAAGA